LALRQSSKSESEEVLNILKAIKDNPEVTHKNKDGWIRRLEQEIGVLKEEISNSQMQNKKMEGADLKA